MSQHDCNDAAAAYVLGALEEHEVASFRNHLESCAICRDEVTSMQLVVDLLPTTVSQIRPPRALKRRVMAQVKQEARVEAPVRRRRSVFGGGLALAGAVAATLLVLGPLSGGGSAGGPPARQITAQVFSSTGHASLRESGSRSELVVNEMPPPPARHIYQVWLRRPGSSAATPTNALFNVTADGSATVDVPGSLRGVRTVMVTAEPLGGSRTPTGAAVIVAQLS